MKRSKSDFRESSLVNGALMGTLDFIFDLISTKDLLEVLKSKHPDIIRALAENHEDWENISQITESAIKVKREDFNPFKSDPEASLILPEEKP